MMRFAVQHIQRLQIEIGKYFVTFRLQTMLDFRNHPLIIYRSVLLNERILNILHQGRIEDKLCWNGILICIARTLPRIKQTDNKSRSVPLVRAKSRTENV